MKTLMIHFLHLFPNFVDEFNELLVEDGREYPKSEKSVNHCITASLHSSFALELLISVKIAEFLRYSLLQSTTIV